MTWSLDRRSGNQVDLSGTAASHALSAADDGDTSQEELAQVMTDIGNGTENWGVGLESEYTQQRLQDRMLAETASRAMLRGDTDSDY